MSTLTDPDFSGRHLREVLSQRPDRCEAAHFQQGLEGLHDARVQLAFMGCLEKPADRIPLLATR